MKKILLLSLVSFIWFPAGAQLFTDSNLPIVIITTDTDSITGLPIEIPDDPKVLASMKIIYHTDGSRNSLADKDTPAYLDYDGRIAIEIRGSTSQSLPKKPYGFTTLKSNNTSNNNVSLLHMPSENDWVLNALAYDASLLRDFLSYGLARNMGNYASRGRFCEVIINGDYQGLYILMEKIKINSERVNIVKLAKTDNNLPNLSGGYITKCDKLTGGDPVAWQFTTNIWSTVDFIHESPKPADITSEQHDYIKGVFEALESTMNKQDTSVATGFPSMIDVPTFVDFMILNELASNVDGYQLSTFFHKDRNGKLRAGPIWDFNLAYGLDVFGSRSKTDVWQFDNGDNVGAKFWKNLFDNPVFRCYLAKRWNELTVQGMPLDYQVISQQIDSLAQLLHESALREDERWGTISNYQMEIDALKLWLQMRISWLNTAIGPVSNCTFPVPPSLVITRIHYNPVATSQPGPDLEFIEITNTGSEAVDVSGYYFKELGITYIFPLNTILVPNQNVFIASNDTAFKTQYGFFPLGVFTRNLSDKSQKLALADAYGNLVDYVEYQDNAPWPTEADGNGYYLKLADVSSDNALASSWTISNRAITTGLNEVLKNYTTFYPNPASSSVFISNNQLSICGYEVYDVQGRQISSNVITQVRQVQVDTGHLVAGLYTFRVHFENGSMMSKMIMISGN